MLPGALVRALTTGCDAHGVHNRSQPGGRRSLRRRITHMGRASFPPDPQRRVDFLLHLAELLCVRRARNRPEQLHGTQPSLRQHTPTC